MNYLRNVVSDVKLKYRAGRVVADCVLKREQPEFPQFLTECVSIADGHPELVLSTIRLYLAYNQPESAYGGLLLLEQLVSLCNYAFHLALARDYDIQDRIIHLAMKRGEGEAHRKAQRLARLTLLEYSRVFVDDRDLLRLSALASSFEHRTRKSLMRCLNVQNRRVRFRDVEKSDIVPISPKECAGHTSGSGSRPVTPLHLSSAPEVWPCHVCTYLNAPSATRCAACETLRSVDMMNHNRHSPHATPKLTPTTPATTVQSPFATVANGMSSAHASSSSSSSSSHSALPPHGYSGVRPASCSAAEETDETSPINDMDDEPSTQLYPYHCPPPCHGPPPATYADATDLLHDAAGAAPNGHLEGDSASESDVSDGPDDMLRDHQEGRSAADALAAAQAPAPPLQHQHKEEARSEEDDLL